MSSNPQEFGERRAPGRRTIDGAAWAAIAAVIIQLVIGVGMMFGLHQQVQDLKEYTNQRLQALESKVEQLTAEIIARH